MGSFYEYLMQSGKRTDAVAMDGHHYGRWNHQGERGNWENSAFWKQTLQEHDKRFHPNGYAPGSKCTFRDAIAAYGDKDDLTRRLSPQQTAKSRPKVVKSFKLIQKEGHKTAADTPFSRGLTGDPLLKNVMMYAKSKIKAMKDVASRVASDIGGKSFTRTDENGNPSIKSEDRVREKGDSTFHGDYRKVNDILGATVVVPDDESFLDAIESLKNHTAEMGADVVRVHPYDKNGYRDVKCTIQFKDTGSTGEIILADQYMIDAKDKRGGHTVFEAYRNLSDSTRLHSDIEDAFHECEHLSEMLYSRGKHTVSLYDFNKQREILKAKLERIVANQHLSSLLSSQQLDGLKKAISQWQGVLPPPNAR